jgi:hypothetical protein
LLVAALALLVLALMSSNVALAVCSIAASLVAVVFIVRGRRHRQELAEARKAEAARLAKTEADQDETTRVLAAATAEASRRAAAGTARASGAATEPAEAVAADGNPVAPAMVADGVNPAEAVAVAAGGGDPAAPAADGPAIESPEDPPAADTIAPLPRYGRSRVWVVDGRPRYHLAECASLNGTVPEAIALAQAVEDGFTPCAHCDPDNKLTGVHGA